MTLQNIKNFTTIRPAVLALAALCFLLPIFNIKCSSPIGGELKIANVKGITLLSGGSITPNKEFENQMKKKGKSIFGNKEDNATEKNDNETAQTSTATNTKDDKDIKANVFAIVSLLSILISLILCFVQLKHKNLFVGVTSVASFLSLIILAFTLKKSLGFSGDTKEQPLDFDLSMLKVEPALGFYLISLFLITPSVISYIFYKNDKNEMDAKSLEEELLQTHFETTENHIDNENEV